MLSKTNFLQISVVVSNKSTSTQKEVFIHLQNNLVKVTNSLVDF